MILFGERFFQFSANWKDNICMRMHPYVCGLGGLSDEENIDIELAQFLLSAAEMVGREQYEREQTGCFYTELNSSACASPGQFRKLSTISLKHCERGSTRKQDLMGITKPKGTNYLRRSILAYRLYLCAFERFHSVK